MLNTYDDYVKALKEETLLFGKNEYGEIVCIEMHGEVVKLTTFQDNGWMCIHYLWPDGTIEEMFGK